MKFKKAHLYTNNKGEDWWYIVKHKIYLCTIEKGEFGYVHFYGYLKRNETYNDDIKMASSINPQVKKLT